MAQAVIDGVTGRRSDDDHQRITQENTMPNYAGIYASPSGAVGYGGGANFPSLDRLDNSGWVTPPTSQQADQGYYWDWATQTYKKNSPGTGNIVQRPGVGTSMGSMPGGNFGLPIGTQPTTGSATGVQVPYSQRAINPNDPNQRYQAVNIVKSPGIVGAEGDLLASFKKGADSAMDDFSSYLADFKNALSGAMKQSTTASNITPTVGALNDRQAQYDAALNKARADYEALNRTTAANERGIVQQAQDLIPQYDAAANEALRQQLGALQADVSRYKSVSGTPMSLGSNEEQMLARGAAQILVPMKQAQIQQRYNVLGQYAMPVAMDIANREQARIGTFDPSVAAAQFQSGQATAQTIRQLQVIASQMSRTDAVAFLQALAVPAQLQQQILSGQIQQLGALGQIEGQSGYYQGLQDILGAIPSQPQYASMSTGSYPNSGRYQPAQGAQGVQVLYAPNAPQQVNPQIPVESIGRPGVPIPGDLSRYNAVIPQGTYYNAMSDQYSSDPGDQYAV